MRSMPGPLRLRYIKGFAFIVVSGRGARRLHRGATGAAVGRRDGHGWDIRVAWGAAPCQRAPTVRVTGDGSRVTAIQVEVGPQLGPGECPASFAVHGVDIKTARPPAPDITVTTDLPLGDGAGS